MKVKRISNTSEVITYHELLKGLKGTDFLIFPKLPLKDVIEDEIVSELNKPQKNLLNTSHFDFVVSTSNHIPIFAVEFDGPHHFLYEKKQISDIRKNRICQIAQLPMIRVSDEHLEKYDTISIVQFIAYRFVMWQKNFVSIKREIEDKINKMTDSNFKRLYNNGYVHPDIDPHFQFDIRYPFPPTKHIREKLINEYNLNYFFPEKASKDVLWFVVLSGNIGSRNGLFYEESNYGLYKGFTNQNIGWNGGKLSNPDINILAEGTIRFSLKWALITAEDYDKREPPIFYENRKGFLPIYHGDIPGAHLPSIIRAISEYLGYKILLEEVEKLYINKKRT